MDFITAFDLSISQFLLNIRSFDGIVFFLSVSALGKVITVFLIVAVVSLYFLWRRKIEYLLPFLFTIIGTELTVYVSKLLFERMRPGEDIAYYIEKSFSFPSGHAAIAMALYGFLAYVLIKENKNMRRPIMVGACTLIGLIGVSRMYLGVHYFSDVLGGYLVGALWLTIGIALSKLRR